MGKKPPKVKPEDVGESDSDVPLGRKLANEKKKIENNAEKEAKAIRAQERKTSVSKRKANKVESESDDDVPLAKKKPAAKKANGVKKEVYGESFSPIAESPVDGFSDEEQKKMMKGRTNGYANGHAK